MRLQGSDANVRLVYKMLPIAAVLCGRAELLDFGNPGRSKHTRGTDPRQIQVMQTVLLGLVVLQS